MGKERVMISEVEIAEYVYKGLIKLAYTPSADEVFDIAEILFSYLLDKTVINIDEVEDDEGEF
jgi:hypothetical protein